MLNFVLRTSQIFHSIAICLIICSVFEPQYLVLACPCRIAFVFIVELGLIFRVGITGRDFFVRFATFKFLYSCISIVVFRVFFRLIPILTLVSHYRS